MINTIIKESLATITTKVAIRIYFSRNITTHRMMLMFDPEYCNMYEFVVQEVKNDLYIFFDFFLNIRIVSLYIGVFCMGSLIGGSVPYGFLASGIAYIFSSTLILDILLNINRGSCMSYFLAKILLKLAIKLYRPYNNFTHQANLLFDSEYRKEYDCAVDITYKQLVFWLYWVLDLRVILIITSSSVSIGVLFNSLQAYLLISAIFYVGLCLAGLRDLYYYGIR